MPLSANPGSFRHTTVVSYLHGERGSLLVSRFKINRRNLQFCTYSSSQSALDQLAVVSMRERSRRHLSSDRNGTERLRTMIWSMAWNTIFSATQHVLEVFLKVVYCPLVIHPQCAGNENIRLLACLIAMLLIVHNERFDLQYLMQMFSGICTPLCSPLLTRLAS